MKTILRVLLSMWTAFVLFVVFVATSALGSLSLTDNLAFFSGIDDTPLFRWLNEAGRIRITWWIYLMIGCLTLLALNTAACTIDGILKKSGSRNLLLKLSPQIMHAGVLFIMLGHLLTASSGFKTDVQLRPGEEKAVGEAGKLHLKDAGSTLDKNGYATDWSALIKWTSGNTSSEGSLTPAGPAYLGGFGFFIKAVETEPEKTALIRISKDPGAVWALLGGILLVSGGVFLAYGRKNA